MGMESKALLYYLVYAHVFIGRYLVQKTRRPGLQLSFAQRVIEYR
jgi:hypothetical protein